MSFLFCRGNETFSVKKQRKGKCPVQSLSKSWFSKNWFSHTLISHLRHPHCLLLTVVLLLPLKGMKIILSFFFASAHYAVRTQTNSVAHNNGLCSIVSWLCLFLLSSFCLLKCQNFPSPTSWSSLFLLIYLTTSVLKKMHFYFRNIVLLKYAKEKYMKQFFHNWPHLFWAIMRRQKKKQVIKKEARHSDFRRKKYWMSSFFFKYCFI